MNINWTSMLAALVAVCLFASETRCLICKKSTLARYVRRALASIVLGGLAYSFALWPPEGGVSEGLRAQMWACFLGILLVALLVWDISEDLNLHSIRRVSELEERVRERHAALEERSQRIETTMSDLAHLVRTLSEMVNAFVAMHPSSTETAARTSTEVVQLATRIEQTGQQWQSESARLNDVEERLRYALNEISDVGSKVRFLLPDSAAYQQFMAQSRASFEYQWKNLPSGMHTLKDENFVQTSYDWLEKFTGLPKSSFAGKKVLDAGCGNGRWSWVLSSCGADVTAVDQSPSGVASAIEFCKEFPSFRAFQKSLLEPLGMVETFDFVWCFGVVHHTGNTWLAFKHVTECVKPGGHIFLMIYGEPRWSTISDFQEINGYVDLRRKMAAMGFDERVEFLRKIKNENEVHGWFDAVSPSINDLYRFDEIASWFHILGFQDVQLTYESRNLFVVARKPLHRPDPQPRRELEALGKLSQ